jgi:hypothetical protein
MHRAYRCLAPVIHRVGYATMIVPDISPRFAIAPP